MQLPYLQDIVVVGLGFYRRQRLLRYCTYPHVVAPPQVGAPAKYSGADGEPDKNAAATVSNSAGESAAAAEGGAQAPSTTEDPELGNAAPDTAAGAGAGDGAKPTEAPAAAEAVLPAAATGANTEGEATATANP